MNLNGRKSNEPRWPLLIAMLAIGGLYAALPASLSLAGPRWVMSAVVIGLLVPLEIAHHKLAVGSGHREIQRGYNLGNDRGIKSAFHGDLVHHSCDG